MVELPPGKGRAVCRQSRSASELGCAAFLTESDRISVGAGDKPQERHVQGHSWDVGSAFVSRMSYFSKNYLGRSSFEQTWEMSVSPWLPATLGQECSGFPALAMRRPRCQFPSSVTSSPGCSRTRLAEAATES